MDGASVAFGDESIQVVGAEKPCYLLCACSVDQSEREVRDIFSELGFSAMQKLHWYDMNKTMRRQSMELIDSRVALKWVVIVRCEFEKISKQERARRKCLWRLLQILDADGVRQLVLENRDFRQDQRDEQLFSVAQQTCGIKTVEMIHVSGFDDSRLWIPDQILGAYCDMCRGAEGYGDFVGNRTKIEKV
jgi:hypothetical protein